jgi:hypothetical protein
MQDAARDAARDAEGFGEGFREAFEKGSQMHSCSGLARDIACDRAIGGV